jgi:hypothetical protein
LQRVERVRKIFAGIYPLAVLALEIVAHDKDELIERTRKHYETFGPSLMMFTEARGDAKAVMDMIRSAELRLAAALAVIEGDQ